MTKGTSRAIGWIMLSIAAAFVFYALRHPESVWPWSNTVSYGIYIVYLVVMAFFFIAAPFRSREKRGQKNRERRRTAPPGD